MKTKHTKGQWEFSIKENGSIQIYSKEFGGICKIPPHSNHLKNEMNANAKLIVAAPELLKALEITLKAMLDLSKQIPNDETLADFNFDLCEIAEEKALKAIRKATK